MITTIYLYGELGRLFGRKWKLAVSSVGEAIRAIEANRPGLIQYLDESGERGIKFRTRVNGEVVSDLERLAMRRRISKITIAPVVRGSKSKSFGLILGIVLIIVAVAMQQYQFLPALAKMTVFGTKLVTIIGMMGVGMAIGGVAALLTPTPDGPGQVDAGKQSYLFGGPENTTTQGGPVPICYGGPILVGSQVISAGIYTEDTSIVQTFNNGGGSGAGTGMIAIVDGPFVTMQDPIIPVFPY